MAKLNQNQKDDIFNLDVPVVITTETGKIRKNVTFEKKSQTFSTAADSQPAVSMQIRQLEESVGSPLFEKTGKRISLTGAGEEVFHYSQVINRQLNEMQEVLESLRGLSRGRLHVAVASTINYFAPRLMAAFHRKYPGIHLELDVTNREKLIHKLQNEGEVKW